MPKLMLSAAVLMLLANCATPIVVVGSETEKARCEVIGEALPTRSRSDTQQTQTEVDGTYTAFEAACPEFAHLIPGFGG